MYSRQVLDHFEHPRNTGELADATASVRVENPACGDIMQLDLRLEGERIAEARFKTRGCVTAIACGSCLTEMLVGSSVGQARGIRREEIVTALSGLRPESMHASYLVMDALHEALKSVEKR